MKKTQMINIENVYKTFDGDTKVRALNNVSLSVNSGEIFGVVGTSGAGKSTLIRAINALERVDSGEIVVNGHPIHELSGKGLRTARRDIGMIFQQFNLLSSKTALGNVELALSFQNVKGDHRKRALELLDRVGLSDRANLFPAQLSGGQKQRVGIARALASSPPVLLSDEATSALDPETTTQILRLIQELNKDLGLTVLLITHEMDVVKTVCSSAALMKNGQIVESGRLVELLSTPGSLLSKELFPLGALPPERGNTIIEVTFTELKADQPFISRLVREHDIDASLLGAAIENIGDTQIGRTRLELPGSIDQNREAISDLQANGLIVDIVNRAVL